MNGEAGTDGKSAAATAPAAAVRRPVHAGGNAAASRPWHAWLLPAQRRGKLLLLLLLLILLLAAGLYLPPLPATVANPPWSRAIYASNGELLDVQIASDEQWRLAPPDGLPQKYIAAVLAFEDRQFFRHPGVNPLSVVRAAASNLAAGKRRRGASTITMQLARLALRSPPRTYANKLREAWLALQLEARYSKQEILALYAAHAPFGGNIVGLSAASWHYFSRAPDELSWAEASLLAVLPNSPALLHPGRNRDALQRKRDRLLAYLHTSGVLTDNDYQLALLEPLPQRAAAWPALAPHLLQRLIAAHPQQASFRTTIDAHRQQQFLQLAERAGRALAREGVHNIAIVAIDHRQMQVVAYVGNHATTAAGQPVTAAMTQQRHGADVDIARRPRSTGSILKPLLYGLMLQEGELLPTTLVPDVPTTFGSYSPRNFDHGYRGAVTAQEALAQSLNVPAVRMLSRYGVERFRERLRSFGLSTITRSAENYGLSLILGGAEASLWELTSLYANVTHAAAQNSYPALRHDIALLQGETANMRWPQFPLQPGAAWLTLQVMINVVRPGADSYWRDFEDSQVIAWKTGTSYGLRDGWAIGSNGRYTVGVWTGNADGAPAASLGGAHSAGPILMEAFALLGKTAWIKQPANALKQVDVCVTDGYLATEACARRTVLAPADSNFTRVSPHHPRIFLSQDGRFRVHSGCESPARMQPRDWFVLPPAQEYFWKKQHSEYQPLPPWRRDCIKTLQQHTGELAFDLIYPDSENTLHIPLDLNGKLSQAAFRAVHRDAEATLHWHLDGTYLGKTRLFHEKAIRAAPGQHLLVLVDDNGQRLERRFSVVHPVR